jgi:hypothetical protein
MTNPGIAILAAILLRRWNEQRANNSVAQNAPDNTNSDDIAEN